MFFATGLDARADAGGFMEGLGFGGGVVCVDVCMGGAGWGWRGAKF